MKLIACTKTVKAIDHLATAEKARSIRRSAGISLREMARRMGFTAGYVSDLELGRRHWNETRVNEFNKALNQ